LNQGYGWAGDVNLRFIFEKVFSVEPGCGYPAHRAESQAESRLRLSKVSKRTHFSFAEIISGLEDEIILPVLEYPGIPEIISIDEIEDKQLRKAFLERLPK
jgi:hypothetical protein